MMIILVKTLKMKYMQILHRSRIELALTRALRQKTAQLIAASGFAEYYDPLTAEGCGGGAFTWTSAMVIEILSTEDLSE